jgi:enamine deaminase RidA (YjgF/YER057c/UK114 family)
MDDVQKENVFLTDMNDFAAMNEIYKQTVTIFALSCQNDHWACGKLALGGIY